MTDVFSDTFFIQYNPILQCLTIWKGRDQLQKLFDYKLETFKAMGFAEASKFLGEGLLLLIPECRAVFLPETKDTTSPTDFISRYISMLEGEKHKSADQCVELSKLYLIRSRFSFESDDVLRADKLVREAAKLGSQEAVEILANSWDELMKTLPNKS